MNESRSCLMDNLTMKRLAIEIQVNSRKLREYDWM